ARSPSRGVRPVVLPLVLPLRLLGPPLAVRIDLLARLPAQLLGVAAHVGPDLLRLFAGLADQRAVFLEQPPRFHARVVGIGERLAYSRAPFVDHRLDWAERPALRDVEGRDEADDRPD